MFHSTIAVLSLDAVNLIPPTIHVFLGVAVLGLFDIDVSDILGSSTEDDREKTPQSSDEFEDDEFFDAETDFGEFDDFPGGEDVDDEFDDDEFGATSTDVTETLEPRIDELERDVEGISNTISTVRSENEEIKESVATVEENIRKLLEVYEFVTSGANPFVDDVSESDPGDGSFGLVSRQDEDDAMDTPTDTAGLPDDIFGSDDDVPSETTVEKSSDEGRTFEELKAEYEAADGPESDADTEFQFSDSAASSPDESLVDSEQPDDKSLDDQGDVEEEQVSPDQPTEVYLPVLPEGYGTELIVLEWLEYLYRHGGTRGTHRAIAYYESLSWISEEVATELRSILTGITENTPPNGHVARTDGAGEQSLGIEHHRKSLEYISLLTGWEVTPHTFDIPGEERYGF